MEEIERVHPGDGGVGGGKEGGMILFQLTSRSPPGIVILIAARFRGQRGNDPAFSEKLNRLLLLIPLPLCFRTAQGIVSGAAASGCGSPSGKSASSPPQSVGEGRRKRVRKVLSRELEPVVAK